MQYKASLKMHLNQGSHGSTRVSELDDFPGVMVTDIWHKKEKRVERIIFYNEVEYKKISDAVDAWRLDKNKGGKCSSSESV